MTSVDRVFTPQTNTFVKLLAERLEEKFGVEYRIWEDDRQLTNYTEPEYR